MEIEDLIPAQERLQQGIFFTKNHVVEKIITHFDFKNIKTVVDSAAGSCNFLIPLALKFPDINFYGVEKNPTVFTEVSKQIEHIKNLHYFIGDIILDNFPIPECDLYLGNPPFVNFSDLEESYRELIKPVWLEYFPKSVGFKMLLGDSRGDISQLIFAITVKKYLKNSGELGVILPNSLIKGNSASAGFREFNNIRVKSLFDISQDNPFDNTERNCFYILAEKGAETTFPISYYSENREIQLHKVGEDLIEEGKSILGKSSYSARQGVNTLGANSVFIFKDNPPFESPLIYPLLKSSDIHPFRYKPSYKILIPYIKGKPIPEYDFQFLYPDVYKYLTENRELLENRKSRFVKKCWYGLFGVGVYTMDRYKVVWRGLGARELMAAVTENVIPNQAMNCYIATESSSEAHYICGIMNSDIYKKQLSLLNEEGAKSFAQPNTINKIFIPQYNFGNNIHNQISSYSKELHTSYSESVYSTLNSIVEALYKEEGFL